MILGGLWLLLPGATAQAQCLNYTSPGLYSFTVPAGGPFSINMTAKGASGANEYGGSTRGGSGATARANFSLQSGDRLTVMVGAAVPLQGFEGGGGGGGTAVVLTRNSQQTLLIAAGGGGGASGYAAGLGGQGTGSGNGGQGGSSSGGAGGGGGGGLNSAGQPGQAALERERGGGGGQASLTSLSPGGTTFAGGSGGTGFGGGGSEGSYSGGGGGGGGYGGGYGGQSSNTIAGGQGGYSFIAPVGSTTLITPGANGSGDQQNGLVTLDFPTSAAMASLSSSSTSICAGQSTNITGTIHASGTWTIILSDGTTQSGTGSSFSIPVTPPSSTTYTIQCLFDANGVAQAGSLSWSTAVTINSSPPIAISQQPVSNSTVTLGANVRVPVGISGSPTSLQWYKDGAIVSGQTSATLTLNSITSSQAGSYSLVATSACNSLTTNAFSLSVLSGPQVSGTKTVLGNFTPGGSVTYTIVLTNTGQTDQPNNSGGNEFSDLLASSLTYTGSSATSGTTNTIGGSISWDGGITAGSSVTITIQATIKTGTPTGQVISNQGFVYFDANNSGDNESQAPTDDPTVDGTRDPTRFTVTCPPLSVNLTSDGPLTCAKTSLNLMTTGGPAGATYTFSGGAQTSDPTSGTARVTQAGPYSVTVTATNGCSATASTTVTSNTVAPSVSISPSTTTICAGQSIILTASGADTYRWSTSQTSIGIVVTATGTYSVTGTSTANGCTSTATASVTVIALPDASFSGLSTSVCVDASPSVLSPATAGGSFSGPGISGNQFNPGTAGVGGPYTITYIVSSQGCSNSSTQSVTVKPQPAVPTLVTQSGHPYPGGVSNLTISQNTGDVILMVGGCAGGTINWAGGSAATFPVSTSATGTFTYRATCTIGGCISPEAIFTINVVTPTLSVQQRDADFGTTSNQIIKPYLQLSNSGNQAIPYNEVTVRYWFTSEGSAPPTDLAVYYAQLGPVQMKYVALDQPRQGAYGYVEYSFQGAGSLAANGNSGPIENGIQKTDRSNFNELDDYSYAANYATYTPNSRITAYRNGVIFWGQEPAVATPQTTVRAYSAAKDSPTTSQIQTRVELRNEGNTPISVQDLSVRYYFTSDNGQLASVYVDYADIGAPNVQARVVRLASPVGGADSYVELKPVGSAMLAPMSSLGAIDFRLVRSDNGLFDQTNDYSYAANYGNVGLNSHITVYLGRNLAFGTPPLGAPARLGTSEESSQLLQVRVLGNPVVGAQAEVEISGVVGQSVKLRLVDLQGRMIYEQRIDQASSTERVLIPVGSGHGLLLLKVSTDTQQQQVKLLKP